MTGLRTDFEQWVLSRDGVHLLTLKPEPMVNSSSWWGDYEVEVWMANPYSHPWTAGAYEAWKHLHQRARMVG